MIAPLSSGATVWVGRILTLLAALALFADAVWSFIGPSIAPDAFRAMSSAGGFRVDQGSTLGWIMLVCAILYAVPRTAVLGAILTTAFYGGAVATEYRIGSMDTLLLCVVLAVMAWGGLYLRDARLRALIPLTSSSGKS